MQAGILNTDFLWPRASSKVAEKKSGTRRKALTYENNAIESRSNSSRSKWGWQKNLWGVAGKKGGKPLQADDLPPVEDSGDSEFSLGHRLTSRGAIQPKLRCTELDEVGKIILNSEEFKKTELIAKVHQAPLLAAKSVF